MNAIKAKRIPTASDFIAYSTELMISLPYDSEDRPQMEEQIQHFERMRDFFDKMIRKAHVTFPKARNPFKEFVAVTIRVLSGGRLDSEGELSLGIVVAILDEGMGPAFVKEEGEVWAVPVDVAWAPPKDGKAEMQAQSEMVEFLKKMGVERK